MNLIFGAGGFAKEVDWLIHDIYEKSGLDYRADFFIIKDDAEALVSSPALDRPTLKEKEAFSRFSNTSINAFIAVADPSIRRKIVTKIKSNLQICNFPNLIHPDVAYDKRPGKITMGKGNIICAKNVLTTDIVLGNFVHINLACTIGHDCMVGDFSTFAPGVHVSGNVAISENVFIGTGAVILEKISITSNVIIGAGATATSDINAAGVYVGIPARRIK